MGYDEFTRAVVDPNNWSDDFFASAESTYFQHLDKTRSVLVEAGLWERFDRAFSAWKAPGKLCALSSTNKKCDSSSNESVDFKDFMPFEAEIELPGFPVDCLPDRVRDYVLETSESLQVPVDMPGCGLLALLALCVQKKYTISPKPGWIEPLNLYVSIAGRPSERKSAVIREIARPIYEFTALENKVRAPRIVEYNTRREVLLRQLDKAKISASKDMGSTLDEAMGIQEELDKLEPVKPLRLVADDVTPEALTSLLCNNDGRMGVISSEGGLFGTMSGRYSDKTNIDVLLKAYSGDTIFVDRRGRASEAIEDPALTILLFVQPSVIQDIMRNAEFEGRGFLARFLYSFPASLVGKRKYDTPPISDAIRQQFDELVYELLKLPDIGEARVLKLDQGASDVAEGFFDWIESRLEEELSSIEAWAGKLHGQTMRIAGILHCAQWGTDAYNHLIDQATMGSAVKLGTYFLAHAQAAFQTSGVSDDEATRDAKYVWRRINTLECTELGKKELLHLCDGRIKSAERLNQAVMLLESRGYLRTERIKTSGRGRPSEKIVLNPNAEIKSKKII